MIIKNGDVFTDEGVFRHRDLCFDRRIRRSAAEGDAELLDAAGCFVLPGLVDIHTHGAAGRDFSDAGAGDLDVLSEFYAAHGVTSFCATTLTVGVPELLRAMAAVRDFGQGAGAKCAGVNLEGPFLSESRKGAQDPACLLPPDFELFRRLDDESGGRIRLVTAAPELTGAMRFIEKASELCTVSIGHSDADYAAAMDAFRAGASHVTHLYNAMADVRHRQPGIIGAAADAGATVELICDGFHVHPSVVRMTYSVFGPKISVVSDSLRCTGMPDGDYVLAGLSARMRGGKARLADGTIAGSTVTMLDSLKNLMEFGLRAEEAIPLCAAIPARVIGAGDIGALAVGSRADVIVLDRSWRLLYTFVDGRLAYSAK